MTPPRRARRIAVVGGGWAGLAAAVQATAAGHAVTLFEMAARPGGRARTVQAAGHRLDNGQHILIGAYRSTLALMRQVGADPQRLLQRSPLTLVYPDGSGLVLPPGGALVAFTRGVLAARGWRPGERLALLATAGGWALRGFRAPADATVAELCRRLPPRLRADLLEPLCVAALNTPAAQASAEVFLRVLKDALFGGRGSADLLLPRAPLGELLPEPAAAWLQAQRATLRWGHRVQALEHDGGSAEGSAGQGWRVDGERFDAVVLAASATEAARLTSVLAPAWSAQAAAFAYEPIVTVYLRAEGWRAPQPMVALREGAEAPAQFMFDLGRLGWAPGCFAFVVSGARAWVERGLPAVAQAVIGQAQAAFGAAFAPAPQRLLHVGAEKRATFACRPALQRPPAAVAAGLWAAGDYTEGPYPATLEGAVRSGLRAARAAAGGSAAA